MNTMTETRNLVAASEAGPERRVRMTASEAFVETLVAHQVKDVFGIAGPACLDAIDLFPGAGIRLYGLAQEQSAAHMADGYGRVSRRPAVCIAQNALGMAHFVTAVAAASRAHTPLVVVTPESGRQEAEQGDIAETDPMPIFSKITRWQAHVDSPHRMAELMHRAFTVALHERGPVQVHIARDSFYGEGHYEILTPRKTERAAGVVNSLEKAAKMLAGAKSPVIIAGGGVAMSDGIEEVKALAEHLTAPVVNAYLHNDSFPAGHPLSCGPLGQQGSKAAMRILARADVVLALGARLDSIGTQPQYGIEYWPAGAKVIQVDTDCRVSGVSREVTLTIEGDARLATAELVRRLKARGVRKPDKARLTEVQREKEVWIAELANWPSSSKKGAVAPRRALAQLAKALPRNAIVSTDVGNVCSLGNSYLWFDQPLSFLAPMSGGACGYAWPTALGAKVAQPERPVIAYVGDGAWGMSLAEMMTAVKEKIPAVAVVFNNGQWSPEKKSPIDSFDGRFTGTRPANLDFSEVARVMGAEGYRVEHEDEVSDALKAALRSGKPSVVEIPLIREPADPSRRDLLRPRRLLPKYRRFSGKDHR